MKAGEIHVHKHSPGDVLYSPSNMVVVTKVALGVVHFQLVVERSFCNNAGALAVKEFDDLFTFYF